MIPARPGSASPRPNPNASLPQNSLRIILRFALEWANIAGWMPHLVRYPQASLRRFCARSGHSRYSVWRVDLHSRTGYRPGHEWYAGYARQLWRDSSARADSLDGWPARTRLPSHGIPPGVDARGRKGLTRFVELPRSAGRRVATRRAAPQPVLLWKSAGGRAARSDGAW